MSNGESGCPGSRYEGAVLIIDRDVASACVIAVVLARFMPVRIASTVTEAFRSSELISQLVVLLALDELDVEAFWYLRMMRDRLPHRRIVATASDTLVGTGTLEAISADAVVRRPFTVDWLLRRLGMFLPSCSGGLSQHVSAAVEHVRGHCFETLTVPSIAEAVKISSSRLAHLFSAELGISVKDFVTRVRVEVAKRALLESDEKLESIAERLGFCDASHLSRVFHKIAGECPGRYRHGFRQDTSRLFSLSTATSTLTSVVAPSPNVQLT